MIRDREEEREVIAGRAIGKAKTKRKTPWRVFRN